MVRYPCCRILAIIGSGETSPTMVTVHRDLVSRLGLNSLQAVMLATPYAFQENAADVSARAQRYFADSVGLQVHVTAGTSPHAGPEMAPPLIDQDEEDEGRQAAGIRAADWVFAGPGSPSYALAHWQAGPVAAGLRDRVLAGDGLTVLASAAAATAGQFTVPVYEIYKAGGALRWLAGLDLLGAFGLTVAVIPHYDNAEGGHYDTRHCYLGERRLAVMERELPADAAVLGVDEHTAVLIDLRTEDIEIRGRGGVTVRRAGDSVVLPSGTGLSVAKLRDLVRGIRRATGGWGSKTGRTRDGTGAGGRGPGRSAFAAGEAAGDGLALPLPEIMATTERGFGTAASNRDADAMVGVILELESTIKLWEADTDEDQGTEQARALLRSLIERLGRAARDGLADPRDRLRPAVEPLLALRTVLRGEGNFAAADAIREALAAAGLDVSDTPEGTRWQPAETVLPAADRTLHLAHVDVGLEPAGPGRTTLRNRAAREEPDSVPGMNSGLSPSDPMLVAAFRSALLHQGAIALIALTFLWLIWATARTWRYAAPAGKGGTAGGGTAEARGRRLLRIGFGVLWIFDGLLQAQPKMAGGLAAQVIEPIAATSPRWVQHLVNWGGTVWSYHPIQAGAASVWIQVGIGAWLIVAARGPWSRLAGAASVAWGLIVWVFGESFGGIFAPGLSWLTGAPGGVLYYVAAGALITLPESAWRSPRLGRLLLAGLGLFFIGMAVLQAWPGRGFWQGTVDGKPGTLSGMVQTMSATPQPHFLSALLSGFGSLATRHGFAVNLVVVIVLAAMGAVFLTGRPRLVRYAVWPGIVFCMANWVLVQDLGFLGGLGTDPNSMIPLILLFSAGYLALTPAPQEMLAPQEAAATDAPSATIEMIVSAEVTEDGSAAKDGEAPQGAAGWPQRLRPGAVGGAVASARARSVAAVGALVVILIGAAPMASAAANRTADPILALAIAGDSTTLNLPAPGFSLTDQDGQTVSLASLRGKVVLMTFLDPVCSTDCPLIAQEFKQAGHLLGTQGKHVELVAVVANPTYRSPVFTRAFDRQEGLAAVPNWLYLTGTLAQLSAVWRSYGVTVENLPAGAMSAHNDLAVVIDPAGVIRQELGADPGPGTASTRSSFSVLLSQYARQALGRS